VLKIRGLLEQHYQPATANRMLSALRGVLRECWQGQLMTTEEHQAAISVPAVRGESERRGRDLSTAGLRSLFEACTRPPRNARGQDSAVRRRRDAVLLALAYGCGLRRSEAVAVDVADLDLVSGELRVRRGKGKKPRQVTMPPSTVLALEDWLQVRGSEPGPLFCAVLKSGRLVRAAADLARLTPAAAWRICQERGLKAQIQAPAPHDLRRTWIGDLLDLVPTWPPCRRWRGTPRPRPPPATTGGIEACSAGPPSCSRFPTRHLRTERRGTGRAQAHLWRQPKWASLNQPRISGAPC
jgi:integrase/recombinase XerD